MWQQAKNAPLAALRTAVNGNNDAMAEVIKALVNMFNNVVKSVDKGSFDVELLGGYTVTYNGTSVTVPYGTAVRQSHRKTEPDRNTV